MKTIISIFLLFMCLPLFAQEAELDDFLAKLKESHGDISTLAVRFKQTKYFTFIDNPLNSDGFILFEYPGKVRFDITLPFASSLINDGKTVSRYEKVGGKWQKGDFGSSGRVKIITDKIGDWMHGNIDKNSKLFAISLVHDDPNSIGSLILEPKQSQFKEHISKIRIDVAPEPDHKITKISIFEPAGDWFSMVMEKELRDIDLPENCFSDVNTDSVCIELLKDQDEEQK